MSEGKPRVKRETSQPAPGVRLGMGTLAPSK